jgi:hypothetical protein
MSNDIQVGDTVKLVNFPTRSDYYRHPTEDRYLRVGDHIVVTKITLGFIHYRDVNNFERGICVWRFKKVISNQVEVKFR